MHLSFTLLLLNLSLLLLPRNHHRRSFHLLFQNTNNFFAVRAKTNANKHVFSIHGKCSSKATLASQNRLEFNNYWSILSSIKSSNIHFNKLFSYFNYLTFLQNAFNVKTLDFYGNSLKNVHQPRMHFACVVCNYDECKTVTSNIYILFCLIYFFVFGSFSLR